MKNLLAALLFSSVTLVSCKPAYIQPSTQQIPISSDPIGAEVYVDGKKIGKTPTLATLERNRDHILTIVLSGYKTKNVHIESHENHTKLFSEATLSGIQTAADTESIDSGFQQMHRVIQENPETGEYNDLHPSAVTVVLEKD